MKRSYSLLLAGGTALLAPCLILNSSWGSDLKAPFELETTLVLPKKIRNPRVKQLLMDVGARFNGLGLAEPLGARLNKTVTWQNILDAQKTALDQTQLQGTLLDLKSQALSGTIEGVSSLEGFELSGSPGETTGVVNSFANVRIPVFAMGLTEKLTLAVALPIMNVQVSADTGFEKSAEGQAFISEICTKDPIKCNEAKDKLNNAVNQKLVNKGYDPIESTTISGLGDARLVAKYRLWQDDVQAISMRAELTAPTGIAPNADRALDIPTGDGQWDIGTGVIYDLKILRDLTWNTYGGISAQLSDELDRRLPVSETDAISADKERVQRNLGDILTAGSSLSYFVPSLGLTLGAGYTYQHMTKTTYQNGAFEEYRYRLLENEYPSQTIHSGILQAGFSTVEFFKSGRFPVPFQANFAFSHPFAGKNVTTNNVLAGEVVMFF